VSVLLGIDALFAGRASATRQIAAAVLAALACSDADLQTFFLDMVPGSMGAGSMRGKVVWITGASSGIGEALALELALTNATLVLSARRTSRLEQVAAAATAAGAGAVHVVPMDVVTRLAEQSFKEVVADVLGKTTRLDVLVLNAGASQRSLAENTTLSRARSLMELNFFAVVEHALAALPELRRTRGQIAVTSSFTGKIGTPVSSVYSATKHGLQGYFSALSGEVPEVDITMVCPGPVASEIAQAAGVSEDNSNKMPAARAARLMHTALHWRLYESWISPHPPLIFLYVGQVCRCLCSQPRVFPMRGGC